MLSNPIKRPIRAVNSPRAGQVMILTVLALGGTILGATTIAGLLMLYQLRQSTDMANSARAIFAADAGMEKAFFDLFCGGDKTKTPCPAAPVNFSNGESAVATCYDGNNAEVQCTDQGVRHIRAVGSGGTATRAFDATF